MKKIFIFILIFIIFFEITSIIFTKLELFVFNETPKYFFKTKNATAWRVLDKNGNKWHKKNYKFRHISRCFDVEYSFNNVGARDYNDYLLSDPKKSIMLIGDSFAEGYGVEIDKIFAKIIEKKINKKILNFGVSGSDPKEHISKYINEGSKYNFDELIYLFLPNNDFLHIPRNIDNEEKKKNFFSSLNLDILKYNLAINLSQFTYSYNFIRSAYHLLNVKLTNGFENSSYYYQDVDNVDYTFKVLENLINYKEVQSYIVIIPTIYDINNLQKNIANYKNLYWYKEILKLANRNNIILIDLMDFVDFDKKLLYFHACDGHWSEYGSEFSANSFLEKYIRN
jgi:hypothetical protein